MPFALPPWLDVTPQFFTSALEAGARTGLAVADQNQRAQQMAEARAERQAQMQQRAEEQASRDQEFQQTHLLNVQKVAQDAAQLQQQIAHQAALEQHQQTQESRLLNYDTGRLAVENKRADALEKQATVQPTWVPGALGGAPGHWETRGGGVVPLPTADLPPESVQGKSVLDAAGNQIATSIGGGRTVPTPTLTPSATGSLLSQKERNLIAELDSFEMIAASRNPQNPKRARYEQLTRELADIRSQQSKLLGTLNMSTNAPNSTIAGSYTRDASGKLKWTPSP